MELDERRAARLAMGWAALVLALASVTSALARLASPPGASFAGFTDNAFDSNNYFDWIEQARVGHLRFVDSFTLEPHGRVFFHPLFLLLGRIGRWTGQPNANVYELARLACGALALYAIWRFVRFAANRLSHAGQLFTFVVATTAGGLGWLKWFEPLAGAEFSVLRSASFRPASSSFWSIQLYPLFSLSIALLLGCLLEFQAFLATGRLRRAALAGLCLGALVTVHPFDLATVAAVLGAQLVIVGARARRVPWRGVAGLALTLAFALPYTAYSFLVVLRDPAFRAMSTVQIVPPSLVEFAAMLGLPLFIALAHAPALARRVDRRAALLLAWLVLVPILANAPLRPRNLPARLIEGYPALLATLSGITLWRALRQLKSVAAQRVTLVVAAATLSLGNAWVLLRDAERVTRASSWQLQVPNELRDALAWIRVHGRGEGAVLASLEVANMVPARTGHRVYAGHLFLTMELRRKLRTIRRFYDERFTDPARERFLRANGIRYVFRSPFDAAQGGYDPARGTLLTLVGTWGDVRVWEFRGWRGSGLRADPPPPRSR